MENDVRMIDANALNFQYAHMIYPDGTESLGYHAYVTSVQIKDAPTIDAVQVVRCAKCKHWNPRYETMGMCMKHNSIVTFTKPEFFCAFGEGGKQ